MTKVVVFRRPYESGTMKTGLGRYGDGIQRCLGDRPTEVITMDLSLNKGVFNLLTNGLIRPFLRLSNVNDRRNVFHATDELCGILFPFVRGKKVLTVHHVITEGEFGRIFTFIWTKVTRYSLRKADIIISISDTTTQDLLSMGADMDRIVTIDDPVDWIFKRMAIPKGRIIGCIGQLHPRKNMKDAILAFHVLSQMDGMGDLVLCIVGKGQEEGMLRSYTEDLGISDRVEFRKELDEDGLVGFYNECTLILNTSLHEGFGLVTLEAQACGTPVLHLEHARIPERVTRMSVPCSSPEDMAEKAYGLLTDGKRYDALSKKSEEYVKDFNSEFCKRYHSAVFGENGSS